MLKKIIYFFIIFSFLNVSVYSQEMTPDMEEPPEFEYTAGQHPMSDEMPDGEVADGIKVVPKKNNYTDIYNKLESADFSYIHDIDPDQFYDMKDATWSPYPLLRLNSPIYFKNQTIEPGYYLINPREHKGKWYILFKQNGTVKHIIPTYDRTITPEGFYDKHIAKPKEKFGQKVHKGVLSAFGKLKSSKRKDPVKTYMEINDHENYFVTIVIYYANHRYSTIFRTIKL